MSLSLNLAQYLHKRSKITQFLKKRLNKIMKDSDIIKSETFNSVENALLELRFSFKDYLHLRQNSYLYLAVFN